MLKTSEIEACPEVAEVRQFSLPASQPPWSHSGMQVRRGDAISWFAEGRSLVSEEADLWLGPRYALWARVGEDGEIFNGTRASHSFRAGDDGPLYFGTLQGEWADRRGRLATPVEAYAELSEGFEITLVRWKSEPDRGLRALASSDPAFRDELDRLADPHPPPAGWHYLWFLGQAEVFRPGRAQGRDTIDVVARGDAGILQKPVDFPLTPETRVAWRWRYDAMPTTRAEDTPITHDYVSLALEFDNGLDLTWYWSAALDPETHYACPLPAWTARETHWVVRRGRDGLGVWQAEERAVRADYERAVGAAPGRIVAVWLIANSMFGRGEARARFADIVLRDGAQTLAVL